MQIQKAEMPHRSWARRRHLLQQDDNATVTVTDASGEPLCLSNRLN